MIMGPSKHSAKSDPGFFSSAHRLAVHCDGSRCSRVAENAYRKPPRVQAARFLVNKSSRVGGASLDSPTERSPVRTSGRAGKSVPPLDTNEDHRQGLAKWIGTIVPR